MFRFNNPDALLVLLLTAGRATRSPARVEKARRTVAGAGRRPRRVRVPDQDAAGVAGRAGVRPACTWSPRRRPLRRRVRHAARRGARHGGAGRLVGGRSSSWCPARGGPYIGGSQNNSVLELTWATTGSAGSPATRPAASAEAAAAAVGRDRHRPALHRRHRRADRLAAARRPWSLGVAGLVAVGRAPRTDPAPRGAAAVGWLAGGHRRWCSA